jgi:UDP-N-acetylglucosamine 2-epimerase (non-hydrolysing)/GDP/UDP-N,N'-diacetylbacillosamine 2-epimerase (hydrolysing)
MITYHPATLGTLPPVAAADALLSALGKWSAATMVFSGVNADPGGNAISARIYEFVRSNPKCAVMRKNFGQRRYLSLVALSSAVVGNSSSGLIEAPALKTATVNIGERQKGRPRAASVIDCGETEAEIADALARALSGKFQASLDSVVPVYGEGATSQRIVSILRSLDFTDLTRKRFHDLPRVT